MTPCESCTIHTYSSSTFARTSDAWSRMPARVHVQSLGQDLEDSLFYAVAVMRDRIDGCVLQLALKEGLACIDELGVPWYDFGSVRFGLVEHCIA